MSETLNDVDTYWRWHQTGSFSSTESQTIGVDGIFIDEVEYSGTRLKYFEELSRYIKSKRWSSGNLGRYSHSMRDLFSGYVALNPGCPCHERYFHISDLVVVSERSHHSFTNPPPEKAKKLFQIFKRARENQALKLLLPKTSIPQFQPKFGIIDHSFLPGQSQEAKLLELRRLIEDLVCTKRVGALFITDINLDEADVFADWSSFWSEMLEYVAEASAKVTQSNPGNR